MKIDNSYFRLVEYESSQGLIQGIKILKPEKWAGIVFTFDVNDVDAKKPKMKVEIDFRVLENPSKILEDEDFYNFLESIIHFMFEVSL